MTGLLSLIIKFYITLGSSFKDLGTKCFAINKIDNEDILKTILNKL